VLSGEAGAAERFFDAAAPTLWAVVEKLAGSGPDARSAFLDIVAGLKANSYRRLRNYDGRSKLATYLALVARDMLAERLARRLVEAPQQAWIEFERFFKADIRRRVAQRFPRDGGTAFRDDIYQEICLKLIEDDFRRIRAYDGRGSFAGYVLTIVERALIDLVRRDAPRRQLPAAVARLSPIDQEIYIAVVWDRCAVDRHRLAAALQGRFERDPDPTEIGLAIERIAAVARLEAAPASRREIMSLDPALLDESLGPVGDGAPTPEEELLLAEEERSRSALLDAVKAAAATLPPDEKLYLETLFSATGPTPARVIASLMGCRVEEVYRLSQRAKRWMADLAIRFEKRETCPSEPGNSD